MSPPSKNTTQNCVVFLLFRRMRQLLCDHPDRYQFFQFSILQLLPKTATDEEVIHTESLWKKKLLSIPFGMNDN